MTAKEDLQPRRAMLEAATTDLPPDTDLEYRYMFGGIGAFTRGRMFGIVSSTGEIALKLSPEDQPRLLVEEGARPWNISKQYIVVPEASLAPDALREWVARSVAYAQTLPLPKKKRKKA